MALHLITGYAGQEHITSADAGSFNISFVGSGEYVFDRGRKFACTIAGANSVSIADGDGMMQGRHFRQIENTVTDLVLDVGEAGLYRNDLICAEYRKDSETYVESVRLVVIKGTPSDVEDDCVDPSYTHGDITENGQATLNQMPLWRAHFSGIAISTVTALFDVVDSYASAIERIEGTAENAIGAVETAAESAVSAVTEYAIPQPVPYTILASGWNNGVYSFESDYPSSRYDITEIYPKVDGVTERIWQRMAVNGYNATNIIKLGGDYTPTATLQVTLMIRDRGEA